MSDGQQSTEQKPRCSQAEATTIYKIAGRGAVDRYGSECPVRTIKISINLASVQDKRTKQGGNERDLKAKQTKTERKYLRSCKTEYFRGARRIY